MKSLSYTLKKPIHFATPSQVFLSIFIFNIIIDPGNALFHTKIITFFFALLFCIKKICVPPKAFFIFTGFYIAYFVCTAFMFVRPGIPYDMDFIMTYFTTFLTLLLFFIDMKNNDVMPAFNFTCTVICIMTLILTGIIMLVPASAVLVLENETLGDIFMMAESKQVLWWSIPSVFHMASPVIVILYGYKLYDFLRLKKKKLSSFFQLLILFFGLFFSGTRANIFSVILLTVICYLDYIFYYKKRMALFTFLFTAFVAFALLGTFLLLTVKNSSSTAKDGHLESFFELFCNYPQYFLFGMGPGSMFYTKGFGKFVTNTELSYLELIRMFGIFFTIVIMCLYLSPLLRIRKIGGNRNLVLMMSYIAYLFIAGTNPLLIGPTGFIAFWIADVLLEKENRAIAK